MLVETWADLVCPWCYIGKARLRQAFAGSDLVPVSLHRAFQLDPSARTEGRPTAEVLAERYGVSAEQARQMMARVTEAGASAGLDMHLDRTISGNTRDAHRAVLWAQGEDAQAASTLLDLLYAAYFTDGEPVFSADDLAPHVAAAGLDAEAMRAMLATEELMQDVADQQAEANALGATGVPFFVFDRKLAVAGAQPPKVFREALAQVGS